LRVKVDTKKFGFTMRGSQICETGFLKKISNQISKWYRDPRFNGSHCSKLPLLVFAKQDSYTARQLYPIPLDSSPRQLKEKDKETELEKACDRAEEVRLGCDSDVGGGSSAELHMLTEDKYSFIRFTGTTNTATTKHLARSGYAAFMWQGSLNLIDFDGIQIRARAPDRRTYTLNVTEESTSSGDSIYQLKFKLPEDGAWHDLFFPFKSMTKTIAGQAAVR